jgi:hypothetical protein
MTADQATLIKHERMGGSRTVRWFEIYKILFPNAPLPLDPYVDCTIADNVQDFMAFFEREAPAILAPQVNANLFGHGSESFEHQAWVDSALSESISILLGTIRERYKERPQD